MPVPKLFAATDDIQNRLKVFINKHVGLFGDNIINSPRAIGDGLQHLLEKHFGDLLGDYIQIYQSDFARRSMADLAFTDKEGFYHIVDIKTHRLDTFFNMPNLTSVERLARYYQDDTNYFDILMVVYTIQDGLLQVKQVYFVPIEFLSWECLTIGALGWGQIQIMNSNRIIVDPLGRTSWMIALCDALLAFYPREIQKINERITYFERLRQQWLHKS